MPYRSGYGHQIWCGLFGDPLHSCRPACRFWFPWFPVYGPHCVPYVCEPSKAEGPLIESAQLAQYYKYKFPSLASGPYIPDIQFSIVYRYRFTMETPRWQTPVPVR